MRSTLGALRRPRNDSPVPLAPRTSSVALSTLYGQGQHDPVQYMEAYSAVGTLFSIVSRTSNATAQVEWNLWRKAASGLPEDRAPVLRHAALDLWRKPTAFHTRQEFVEQSQQHLDLTGEAWWVVARDGRSSLPIELWEVRPDRMLPVPHPEKFLAGYLYLSPDGERIPLRTDEVIQLRMPNPMDPYRGLGPVQSILSELDSVRYSAEWNRNFFRNSAQPGGVIEMPESLGDDEWRAFQLRWRESHQGISNAHRVALLEGGMKWVDRAFTMRDMQFVELRSAASEVIREAFSFPKPMLGSVDDVNRANAEAGEIVFARWLVVPRLERIKQALNNDLLPLFGPAAAADLEFDYVNPVPADREGDAAELTSKAEAASKLVTAGWAPEDVLTTVGLPEMEFREPPAPQPPAVAPPAQEDVELAARYEAMFTPPDGWRNGAALRRLLAAPAAQDSPAHSRDLTVVQDAWRAALDAVLEQWREVTAAQRAALVDQVRAAVDRGDAASLSSVAAPAGAGTAVLSSAMLALAVLAAAQLAEDAADQGEQDVEPGQPDEDALSTVAMIVAGTLATELTVSAVREAVRNLTPTVTGDDVAGAVLTHLEGLSPAGAEKQLGGALTTAQHAGRMATLLSAPSAAYYASEQLDKSTCVECRKIDGKWLGNELANVEAQYPSGGFRACLGGVRCRGQVVAIWRGGTDPSKWIEKEPI